MNAPLQYRKLIKNANGHISIKLQLQLHKSMFAKVIPPKCTAQIERHMLANTGSKYFSSIRKYSFRFGREKGKKKPKHTQRVRKHSIRFFHAFLIQKPYRIVEFPRFGKIFLIWQTLLILHPKIVCF